MIARAYAQFVRISPRKVRYVIDLIRKKKVSEANAILNGSPRRASGIIRKLLLQAVDAAKKNSQVESTNLMVSKVLADGGPSMKRFRAASMGRASVIHKRTSHITLEVDIINKNIPVSPKGVGQKAVIKKTAEKLPAAKRGGSLPVRQAGAGRRKMAGAK